MMANPNTPPTRIISFQQLCNEYDPNYWQAAFRPWIYQFSNGRLFYRPSNPYADPAGGSEFILDTSSLGGDDVLG